MDRVPRFLVDFNEMPDPDVVLLSRADGKVDAHGVEVQLFSGLLVEVFEDDVDEQGVSDPLEGRGVVIPTPDYGVEWTRNVKWSCRLVAGDPRNRSDRSSSTK